MEKFIALNQTGVARTHQCNNSGCAGCHHKQEALTVADQAGQNKVNILQMYYAALIQCHSSGIKTGSQDASHLHCT